MADHEDQKAGQVQSHNEVRRLKTPRKEFSSRPRRPIAVVLDGVRQNYNIGAIFRLCDAFLVERLVIAGTPANLRKRKLVQAARGTQYWVPWEEAVSAAEVVRAAKAEGRLVIAVEQTSTGVAPEALSVAGPVCLVLGAEREGVGQEIVDMAELAITIPMEGMANSINVASAAAIVLYRLSVLLPLVPAGSQKKE
jgi:tRNA (guanosine-2'-O-)-methyltransferase